MFEIDREEFGQFIAMLRKEKGLTQKEVAEKLFISDKAVSKWETGKSIPDITLLVPLSELLEVSVTELLECRRIEPREQIDTEKTEELVKKVIGLSEEEQPFFSKKRKKHICIYLACIAISVLEMFCLFRIENKLWIPIDPIFTIWILAVCFGCYFWIFIKEKLPAYYDENKINVYVDGILHMNLPGVSFNNNNWPYIVKVLRIWSIIGMIFFPFIYILAMSLVIKTNLENVRVIGSLVITLGFALGGLFIPVLIIGRKYQNKNDNRSLCECSHYNDNKKIIILIMILLVIIPFFKSRSSFFSGTRIGYISKETKTTWSAEYEYLNGYMKRSLVIPKENDTISIEVHTEEGNLSVQIKDREGTVLFEKEKWDNTYYEVETSGKIIVEIQAEKHKGSFQISL